MKYKLVRGSEVSSFLRCRKQWSYAWLEQIEPKRQDNKLFFGNLSHKFMETYYNNLNNRHSLLPADQIARAHMLDYFQNSDTSGMTQVELDELWDLVSKVTENYIQKWKDVDKHWTVLATELRFAIPLDDEYAYEGTIDLVYLDENGLLKFSDYKNVSSIERYVGMAEMDRQISRYWWALEQLARGNGYIWSDNLEPHLGWVDVTMHPLYNQLQGKEPSGFVYNIILKDVPVVPELLKKGGLSKAKNQKTTHAAYIQALYANNLIIETPADDGRIMKEVPNDYIEILEHLAAQETEFGNRFFRRVPVVRNERECQAAMQEFLAVVEDMEEVRTTLKTYDMTYRNINADCSWCNYKALCVAQLDGSLAGMTRNLLYRPKENTHEREEVSEL